MTGPVLRVVIGYGATLVMCTLVYICTVAVIEGELGGINLLAVFALVFVFALLFSAIPFIVARGALAYFERRDALAFGLAGCAAGAVIGGLLWWSYGFTYVGETGWVRMAAWIAVSCALGGVAGLFQRFCETMLRRQGRHRTS